MKRIKPLCYMIVIPSFLSMVFLGSLYGASVTFLQEGSLHDSQEGAVANNHVKADGNQLKFAPQGLKNKSDSGKESGDRYPSVRRERYKPYQEGEGERKVR
jgi:hypothetical protein